MLKKLTPAEKAWQARQAAIAAAPPRSKLNPLSSKVIEIALDRADVASGMRRWIVLDAPAGGSWVKLFSPSLLITIEVRRHEIDMRARAAKYDREVVTAIITRNRAMADRLNNQAKAIVMPDGGADAVKALELMRPAQVSIREA